MSSVLQALLGAPRDWCTLTYDRQEAVTFSSVNKHVILWSLLLSLFFIKDQNKQLSCIAFLTPGARDSLGVSAYRTRYDASAPVKAPARSPRRLRRRAARMPSPAVHSRVWVSAGPGGGVSRGAVQPVQISRRSISWPLVAMAWRAACAHRRHARQRDRGSFCAFILAASPPF